MGDVLIEMLIRFEKQLLTKFIMDGPFTLSSLVLLLLVDAVSSFLIDESLLNNIEG